MEKFFKNEPVFRNVYVKGEVSGTYESPTGHFYFILKDKHSKVPCIVYRWFRKDIGFEIENGMKLLIRAKVSVYWPHGKYQLDVRSATDEGIGKLTIAYNQLKKKLKNEGLFEDKHKKILPEYPKRIGVITSKVGSVIHDIVKTVKKDWPYCQVLLFPAAVQGASSKRDVIAQIKNADLYNLDVLIIARGGGSLEELWSFNEESVVRAIFECSTPVISAIGHEDNTTLSDLVADRRASTPTMAASIAIKNKKDVFNNISHLNSRLITFMSSKLDENKKEFENILKKVVFKNSSYVYNSKQADFDLLSNRFSVVSNELIVSKGHELEKIKSSYSIRHPCKIQVDSLKSKLNELETRLIDAINLIIKNCKVNLDKAIVEFNFQSEKSISSHKHSLETIKKSYLIENPCKIQLNYSKLQLNSFNKKLNISIVDIYDSKENIYLDLKNRFKNNSKELIVSNKHELSKIKSSYTIRHPCKMQLDNAKSKRNSYNNRLNNFISDIYDLNNNNCVDLKNRFKNKSNEIILTNSYELNSIKASPILKNHLNNYIEDNNRELDGLNSRLEKSFNQVIRDNQNNLNLILNRNIIKNPYSMLDQYRAKLDKYEEKLDKINQINLVELEKQKEKTRLIKIIVLIISVFIIIILLLLFGGI